MRMVEHKVVMRGPAVQGRGVLPDAAGAVLLRLENSLHGAVDVAFRRSSSAGRRHQWLRRAGQVFLKPTDIERLGQEEMALYFEAPEFGDVAQEFFSQPKLFDDGPPPEKTAFDVFADAADDVLAAKADSDKYDLGLLKRFEKFESSVFDRGVDEILISRRGASSLPPRQLSKAFPQHARELHSKTPEPSRARVAGKLDMIQASTLAFALVLPDGEQVRGVWKGTDFETLRTLVNSEVVATGTAIYRPSGALLRLDAEALAPQRDSDRFFAVLPVPTASRMDLKTLVREQSKRGGVARVWGQVPAEETDDDFLAAVVESD
jgi:hypothetical protein